MNRLFQFKTMWFLAGMLLIIGCQREDEMPFEEPPTVKRMIVTAADIPDVTQTLLQKMGMGQDAKLFSANNGGQVNELAIDWEHIKQLIDTTGRETYAFGIEDTDPDPRVFYNLVLRYSENKEAHQPFILRYKMDEDFLEEYLQTQSLEHFRGTTQKIPVKGVAGNPERSRAYLDGAGDGIILDEPCPRENPVDGGGGGPDPGSGGGQTYECSSYIVTTTWYSQSCSSDGCEPPVQIGEEQSIVTECGWVYENEAAGTNDDCEPETGEIPIIRTIPDPLDLIMGDNQLNEEDTEKLRAALNELIESQCVYGEMFNYMTSNGIKVNFNYDPTLTAGAFNYQTGTISFYSGNGITSNVLREELFHAYQHNFYTGGLGQYTNVGRSNIEFEVKFMIDLIESIYGMGACCTAFASSASQYPQVVIDYNLWLDDITDGGSIIPDFSDIILDYFNWMGKFTELNPAYNYPITTALNPNAAYNLMNKCNN